METDVELNEGQSFVIAGLLDDRVTENLSKVPGLSHIPILGALFKSRSETKAKTELLVMVTPESIYPLSPTDPKPLPNMPKTFLAPVAPAHQPGAATVSTPVAATESQPNGPATVTAPTMPDSLAPRKDAKPGADAKPAGEVPAASLEEAHSR
jgi:pilus assembly protein CpaC